MAVFVKFSLILWLVINCLGTILSISDYFELDFALIVTKQLMHKREKMKTTYFSFLKLSNIVYWVHRIYCLVDNGNNHLDRWGLYYSYLNKMLILTIIRYFSWWFNFTKLFISSTWSITNFILDIELTKFTSLGSNHLLMPVANELHFYFVK